MRSEKFTNTIGHDRLNAISMRMCFLTLFERKVKAYVEDKNFYIATLIMIQLEKVNYNVSLHPITFRLNFMKY